MARYTLDGGGYADSSGSGATGTFGPTPPPAPPVLSNPTPLPTYTVPTSPKVIGAPDPATPTFGGTSNFTGSFGPAIGNVVTGGMPFGNTSNYNDLLSRLNSNSAAPGTPQFSSVINEYLKATGTSGGPGNGYNYGQLDPTRNKVYVPGGYDLRYENGQWVAHSSGDSGSGGSGASGSGVFSDPATAQWEAALNSLFGNLNTPYTPPDFSALTDYLKNYATKLQGPAYTPEQQALIQTSTTEPIQQQADALKQQQQRQLAARGITPSSGITTDVMNQIDRASQQQKDLANRSFATNAINLQNQNAATAAQVLGSLTSAETGLFQGNEARQTQAVNLAKQIPALADSRLQLALGTLAPQNVNPLSALSTLLNQNNYQTSQDQQYYAQLATMLATLFGSGG